MFTSILSKLSRVPLSMWGKAVGNLNYLFLFQQQKRVTAKYPCVKWLMLCPYTLSFSITILSEFSKVYFAAFFIYAKY